MDNNRRLKLIASAFRFDRKAVAEIVTLGGVATSTSRADGWLRSAIATKQPTGNSDHDAPLARHRLMTDAEFDAFCQGLKPWAAKNSAILE